MKRIAFLLIAVFSACNLTGDRTVPDPGQTEPDAMLSELVFGVIDNSQDVLTEKNFGEQTLQKTEPNHHNPGAPDLEHHRYDTGQDVFSVIWVHQNRSTVKFLLTSVRLRSDEYITGDLKPGISEKQLIAMLGRPFDRRGGMLTYELETTFLPVTVEFILDEKSVVDEIMIEYPYD